MKLNNMISRARVIAPSTVYALLLFTAMQSCKTEKPTKDMIKLSGDPVVDFQFAGSQIAPATIVFNNNTQNASNYKWDMGNGQMSDLQTPAPVTYDQPGSYEVTLTASNDEKKAIVKKTILITADTSPQARFSYTFKDQRSFAPATLILINESVNASAYEWDINGALYTTREPQNITFTQPGTYQVQLKVIKNGISSATYGQVVTVLANPDPVAKFQLAYHPYPYTIGEEIQLVNTSENSDNWNWTFGSNGPGPSTEQHPLIKFATPGVYTITLIAKKGALTSNPRSINLKIN